MGDMYDNAQNIKFCVDTFYPGIPYNLSNPISCMLAPNPCCKYVNQSNPKRCGDFNEGNCLDWSLDYLQWEKPGLGRFYTFMALQFIVQFSIVLFYEAGYFRKIAYLVKRKILPEIEAKLNVNADSQLCMESEFGDIAKDSDVIEEETRIKHLISSYTYENPETSEIFIIDRLTKYYSNFMAVKGISFSMRSSETFGLLGGKLKNLILMKTIFDTS